MSTRPIVPDRVNPVLARELTERMRRRNTPVVVTIFLLAMIAIFAALFKAFSSTGQAVRCVDDECFTEFSVIGFAGTGRQLFQSLVFFMVLLACFIVPALTAGTIAGERERQTLVPLQLTLLSPLRIVIGKLSASLSFMIFLFLATLPVVGVTFLIGGVSITEVVLSAGMIVLVSVAIGAVAIMCSALIRRSQAATVAAYGLVFVLTIGTFVPMTLVPILDRFNNPVRPATTIFLAPNPFVATASVLLATAPGDSPLAAIKQGLLNEARNRPDITAVERALARIPYWILSVLALVAVTVAAVAIAAWALRTPSPNP